MSVRPRPRVEGCCLAQTLAKPHHNQLLNSRVEQTLRPEISAAVKQSKASRKKAKLSRSAQAKEEAAAAEAELHKPPPRRTADGAVKERASDFTQREKVRLNDVVQAPPTLTFGGRAGGKNKQRGLGLATDATKPKRSKELPVSMKQKAEMEAERERAIARCVLTRFFGNTSDAGSAWPGSRLASE